MALLSSLTPVFIAIICVLIGVILKKTNREKEKHETKSKPLSRPWVDEDLKTGTDHHLEEEGKKNLHLSNSVVWIGSADTNKGDAVSSTPLWWWKCIVLHCCRALSLPAHWKESILMSCHSWCKSLFPPDATDQSAKRKGIFKDPCLFLCTADPRPMRDSVGNVGKASSYCWWPPIPFPALLDASKGKTRAEIFYLQVDFVGFSFHFTIQCYIFDLSTRRKARNGFITVLAKILHLWLLWMSMRALAGLALGS